jgi:hypothetical protein
MVGCSALLLASVGCDGLAVIGGRLSATPPADSAADVASDTAATSGDLGDGTFKTDGPGDVVTDDSADGAADDSADGAADGAADGSEMSLQTWVRPVASNT